MDPSDNTFPIPGADQNQGGSATPPPATPNVGQPSSTPNANAQPPAQPSWAAQAAQDAAAVAPGADNNSLTAPTTPTPAGPVTEPAAVQNPVQPQTPQAPAPTGAIPQTPAADPNVITPPVDTAQPTSDSSLPVSPQPNASINPGETITPNPTTAAIPNDNMLDLSGNAAPSQIGAEPNTLQPGVDVNPASSPIQPGTVDPMLGGLPPDFGTSYNAGMAGAAAMETKKKSGPMKFIIIGVAVVALILILSLVVVFSGRNQRKPAVEINEQAVQSQTTSESSTPASLPSGYKYVDRDCYKFGIVEQTTIDFTKTNCKVTAKFGTVSQYDVLVTPATNAVGDLNAFANSAKTGTLVSQTDIKLNNIDAKKLIQTVNGVNQQVIVVIPTGKNYTFENSPVTGFTITTTYNDDTSKTVSDNIVATWTWK